ncbi:MULTISPECIES: DUF6338 family protein [Mycobacteriaceae]|uniref:DUF6338 family protein n=1 Tax=Mycolicibacterium goodii TaxID=134601 RepID=UPI001BDC7989|nr:DUF6338 family protein [Mycolicibacterium goodii]MBU8813180.1 hypothetical protein [Mycolicibacterium goodii]
MISTFQALAIALIAVLPGAVYTIARESGGASWAWRRTDTGALVLRFLCASAVFHALLAPITYGAYQRLVKPDGAADAVEEGRTLSWWWWVVVLVYLLVPFAAGALTERGRKWRDSPKRWKKAVNWFVSLYAGSSPEPRAWDWFFDKHQSGIMRLKLANDEWKAGLWADSFASGYGEDGDLYLAYEYLVDEDGILLTDGDGNYQSAGVGLLVRWSEVRYLEFSEWDGSSAGSAES